MKRVLLVDTSSEVESQLATTIGSRFEIRLALSCDEARQFLAKEVFDIILMEVDLPDGSGFALCSEIKNNEILKMVPVIFLTRRDQVADRIQGFNSGADDYVMKPFEPIEVSLRIDVRLKRSQEGAEQGAVIQKGDLTLSVPFQKASIMERGEQGEQGVSRDLKLTPTEFRLLYFFIKNEESVLTREQLLTTVWSGDVQVLTRTIDKHISTLKKKLGLRANCIQSIHSRGYRFSSMNSVQPTVSASL